MNFQITGKAKAFFYISVLEAHFLSSNLSNPTFLGGDRRELDQKFCPTVREITFEKGRIPSYFPTFPAWG